MTETAHTSEVVREWTKMLRIAKETAFIPVMGRITDEATMEKAVKTRTRDLSLLLEKRAIGSSKSLEVKLLKSPAGIHDTPVQITLPCGSCVTLPLDNFLCGRGETWKREGEVFYIFVCTADYGKKFLKYGVTSKLQTRYKYKNKGVHMDLVYSKEVSYRAKSRYMERIVRRRFGKGVVDSLIMPDGHSETLPVEVLTLLPLVIEEIDALFYCQNPEAYEELLDLGWHPGSREVMDMLYVQVIDW